MALRNAPKSLERPVGLALDELSPHAGSLEQLFLAWTGGDGSDEPVDPAKKKVAA